VSTKLSLPFSPRIAFGLAALSGLLYWIGFPGVDVWPLAFVSQAPLLLALRGQPVRRATLLGLTAGLAMNLSGFAWLLDMLRVFSGFPTPICLFFMVILCAYQGGRIALAGFLYARAERRGWPPSLVFVLAFVASELLYPLLFPWYFGASVHNAPVFMQTADLGGPYLVAAILLGTNVAIAEVVEALVLTKRAWNKRVVAIGLAAPVLGLVYGFLRMRSVDAAAAAAPSLRVGIAQGNQPLLDRPRALPVHFRLTDALRSRGAQLVVWSEGAIPRAFIDSEDLDEVRKHVGAKLHVPAIVGAAVVSGNGNARRAYNTALMLDGSGKVLGRYDKTYLLAFGEYLPLGETFPILYDWSPNSGHFVSGTRRDALALGDHRITTMICYEDILPEFVNTLVRKGDPELLVNITNDAWFGKTSEPWEHFALAKLRAVEHHRYLVRATNSGVSGFIDPVGRAIANTDVRDVGNGEAPTGDLLVGDVHYLRGSTLYELIGDAPVWLAALAVVAMGFRLRSRTGDDPEKPAEPPPKGPEEKAAEGADAEDGEAASAEPAVEPGGDAPKA
jgi:apolipoprotein N-acyltransferase